MFLKMGHRCTLAANTVYANSMEYGNFPFTYTFEKGLSEQKACQFQGYGFPFNC